MNKKEIKNLQKNMLNAIDNLDRAQDEYFKALHRDVKVIGAVHDISSRGNRKIYKWLDNGCDLNVGDIAVVMCMGNQECVLVVSTETMPYMYADKYKKALGKIDIGKTYGQGI